MEHATERLMIRSFEERDFPLYYNLLSDPNVMRYTYWDAYKDEQDAMKDFRLFLASEAVPGSRRTIGLAVFCRETEAFVGMGEIDVLLHNSHGGCAEIGYLLHPDFWGKGYATELARALVELCFTNLGMHKVIATCNANNAASEHVMRKLGMELEGRFRQMRWKHGRWDDELRYTLLRDSAKSNV